jgi:uncharacterized membrane protein YgcG
MRPAFTDFSPTVPATFAAGIGISLSVFLLPAGVVQKGPTPVLPAFGGATGRVAADLPVAAGRVSEVRKAASAHPQIVVALRPPTTKVRKLHHRARTGVVRRAPSAPVQAVAPAAPKTPVTETRLLSIPPTAGDKARGHGRGHAPKPKAATPTPDSAERGKALGRSNEQQDGLPRGRAKASPASPPGLPPRPKGDGDGNGRKGNGGGNGGGGDGGGNGGGGNGGGNGPKWEKK